MKKSLVLAMAMALGVTASAYAANPFSDVPAGHWAYDSINKLAATGVIDGMGNGTFQGDKLMTRYEMAQIVAKAMAKGCNVDKLAAEFADELDNLGVRVANLEKRQDNVRITGQIRASYKKMQEATNPRTHEGKLRTRLFLNGQVNEDWSYNGMLENTQTFTGDNEGVGEENITLKRAYMDGKVGGMKVKAGRVNYGFGNGNILSNDKSADAVVLSYGNKIKLEGSMGQISHSDKDEVGYNRFYGLKVGYKPTEKLTLGADFVQFKDNDFVIAGDKFSGDAVIYDVNAQYKWSNIGLNAMYLRGHKEINNNDINDSKGQNNGVVIGMTYKGAKASEAGSYGLNATYYNQGANTYINHAIDGNTFTKDAIPTLQEGFKGFGYGVNYTLAKNVVGSINYYDTQSKANDNKKDHVVWSTLLFNF